MTIVTISELARICHEATRAYCLALGDTSLTSWDSTSPLIKGRVERGVKFAVEKPDILPAEAHAQWIKEMERGGWTYGDVLDNLRKKHPRMVPFEKLAEANRRKDRLFVAVVDCFRKEVTL